MLPLPQEVKKQQLKNLEPIVQNLIQIQKSNLQKKEGHISMAYERVIFTHFEMLQKRHLHIISQ